MFYNIMQYGKVVRTHVGPPILTETVNKQVCAKLVEIANDAVSKSEMVEGAFDVEVCKTSGEVFDSFICGTDDKY